MAKAVKAAVKVFVVTFAITTGLAFVFQGAGLFALGQVGLTGAFLGGISTLSIAALTAASTLVNGLMSKGTDATIENFGTKVASRSSASPRQIVYGKARVGGTITHIETSGTDNYKLSMIVVLAGHEVESLEEVLINDTKLTTTVSGGFNYATNSRFTNSENENKFSVSNSLIRYKFKDGSQTTADSTITSATSLGSTDKFIGMAYMLIEMVFDSEAFGGGIPPLAFVIKGKKVYDPRTSTTAWSDNPALCVRDYITDTTYGLKATSDEVLDTTALGGFAAAANTCDSAAGAITTATVNGAVSNTQTVQIDYATSNTLIDIGQTVSGTGISGSPTVISRRGNLLILSSAQTIADGVTLTFNEELYKANGITNMAADGSGVLEGLLSSCAGKLSYINGKFVMFAGASVTPDMTITDDNLLAPISVATKNSSGETFNTVKAVYVDGNNNYVATDSPVYTDSTLIANDTPSGESQANYRKTLEIQLPFTDTTTMAQRLQRTALLHSRQEVSLSVLCNIAFMQLQPFDWVYLTNARLGYTNKTFEVLSTNLEVIESDDVPVLATRLVLKEIDASVYSFASNTYTDPIDEGSSVSTGSFTVTAPTNLSVSALLINTGYDLQVQWTNNPDDLIQGTEILFGTSSGTYISSSLAGKGKTKEIIPNVKPNSTYYIVARHFSANNVFSANTSEITISTSSGSGINTPSAPTSLSATTGKPFNIGLSWANPNDSDLRDIKIYRSTSSGFTPNDGTNLVRTIAGVPSVTQKVSFGVDDGLVAGTTYYFKVKAVSFFDKESNASSQASGSFTGVESGDIADGSITTLKLAAEAVTNAKIAVDAIQGDVIAAGAIVEAKLGVDAVTNAKLADNAVQTANLVANAITSTKISDNAITTAKITANAITTAKINAGAITADTIATNAVTANKIIADAITTDKIAANAITAAKIAANTITASEIAANTITATQIAAGAVATDELAANAVTAAKITAGTITATEIASNTITATEMNVSNLSSISANLGSITGGSINIGSGNFTVDTSGNVNAQNITVRGRIRANSTPTGTGQAGLFSELSDTFTGGSDPLRVIEGSDDADKDLFILVGQDSFSMDFDSNGKVTSNNDGLMLFGTGSIFMGSRNSTLGTIEDDSNNLGSSVGRWNDIYATNGTIQTSDANNKSNIANADLGLNFVSQLTPRKYTLNGGDSSRTHYGLIAQEVKTVLDNNNISTNDFAAYIASEVLDENDQGTGEYKYGLRYTELISILIKAIQELEQRVQDLE